MNSITPSVFATCLIKLDEVCKKSSIDSRALAFALMAAMTVDGFEQITLSDIVLDSVISIRNSEPFINLNQDDEYLVYDTFFHLM